MSLLLVALVAVMRSPTFAVGIANIDECDFALFGRMVQAGAVPYRGVGDIKPPLTYAAYHLAELLAGGPSFTAIRLLGIACILATALVLRGAARAWTGDDRAGWAAALLSVLAISCESPAVSAEILMNLPVAVALLCVVHAERSRATRWDLACGVALGVATLVKHQAGIGLVAIGLSYVLATARGHEPLRRSAARGAALAIGFAVPWLVTFALVSSLYDWKAFSYWVFERNLHQVGVARGRSLAPAIEGIGLGVSAPLLVWALAIRRALRPRDGVATALALLAVLTWIPVSVGGRFYEHYFLQFAPAIALLAAPEAVAVAERWPALGAARRAGLVVLAVVPIVASTGFSVFRAVTHRYPAQDPKVLAIAAWLRGHTAPSDRVFLWGDYSVVYCLADRLPGTRYMRTAPHVGDFDPGQLRPGEVVPLVRSERDIAQTLSDLEANRPAVIVDTAAADLHGWSRFPLSRVAELDAYVHERYELVARPGGAAVYLRRPATAARGSDSL